MTFVAPPMVPPIVFEEDPRLIPFPRLPSLSVPVVSVPIQLPATQTPVAPSDVWMPSPWLDEIRLPSAFTMPPITVPGASSRSIPSPPLPSGV